MTVARRASDAAHDFIRTLLHPFKKETRSLSTGDLAPQSSDCMMMEFLPTTSSLPANFDDCDRVPMDFGKRTPRLMKQSMKESRKLISTGCSEDMKKATTTSEIHRSQLWFHPCSGRTALRLLISSGLEEGSFVIVESDKQFVLSYVHEGKINHVKIGYVVKDTGEVKYMIEVDKRFRNLCELVSYYSKHKGILLTKLGLGISRPLYKYRSTLRTRA